jgi:galactose oxidase
MLASLLPRVVLRIHCLFAVLLLAGQAQAQVSQNMVIGVTPTCPYGLGACAVGAREGLLRLDGVQLVAKAPDTYNCTMSVRMKVAGLPDLQAWREQFKRTVGEAFVFRGVELTVAGKVVDHEGVLMLEAEGLKSPIKLAPLTNKLQWNFRKGKARQLEPDEAHAWRQMAEALSKPGNARFEVTGSLSGSAEEPVLEVREYFPCTDP